MIHRFTEGGKKKSKTVKVDFDPMNKGSIEEFKKALKDRNSFGIQNTPDPHKALQLDFRPGGHGVVSMMIPVYANDPSPTTPQVKGLPHPPTRKSA